MAQEITDLVEFDPSDIAFDIRLHEQSLTHLTLTNVADVDIAYKVKTTSPKRYCVRPNCDVLPVGTAIDIELVLHAFESIPDDLDSCRDKFQLLIAPLGDGTAAASSSSLWKSIPPADIVQSKFRVKLCLQAEADGASTGSAGENAAITADDGKDAENPRSVEGAAIAGAGSAAAERTTVAGDRGDQGGSSSLLSTAHSGVSFASQDPPLERLVSAPEYARPRSPKSASGVSDRRGARSGSTVAAPDGHSALTRGPSVEERKVVLDEAIEKSNLLPTAEKPLLSRGRSVEEDVEDFDNLTVAQRAEREREAAISAATAVAAAEKKRARKVEKEAISREERSLPSSLTKTAGGDIYATAIPGDAEDELTEEEVAAIRARVLAGISAPHVNVAELSEEDAQRAAVERAGQLTLVSKAKDKEIALLSAQLAEARHKLEDAKMAVLPAYDVKYVVDENARISVAQIAIMAALSGVVLKLLV